MYSYKITIIDTMPKFLVVYFTCLKDGVEIAKDNVQIYSDALANQPSDGRSDYINQVVADACKKFMVIQDVKQDFSALIGVDVSLDALTYETKAEKEVRINEAIAAQAQIEQGLSAKGMV